MNKANNLWSFKAKGWNQWSEGLTVRQPLYIGIFKGKMFPRCGYQKVKKGTIQIR